MELFGPRIDMGPIYMFKSGLRGMCLCKSVTNDRHVVPACWRNIPASCRTVVKTCSWKSNITNKHRPRSIRTYWSWDPIMQYWILDTGYWISQLGPIGCWQGPPGGCLTVEKKTPLWSVRLQMQEHLQLPLTHASLRLEWLAWGPH